MIDESRGSADGQRGHSVAIIVSSAITVILLVLVSFLCVGGNKNAESSASTKLVTIFVIVFLFYIFVKITRAPVNAVQEASGNAFVMFETFLLSTGLHSECYCCEPT